MKFKNTIILGIIFIALLAYVYFYEIKGGKKRKEAKEKAGKVLVLESKDVDELTLKPSGIHLKRDGEKWIIDTPVQTDADKTTVNAILNTFNWAKIERAITDDSSRYAAYGLDPPKAEMIIKRNTGRVDTLYLGDKNPTGSYVFARKSGSPEVFLTTTTLLTHAQKKLFDIRDKTVLGFDKDEVNKLSLTVGKESFVCTKTRNEWEIESPLKTEADKSKIDQILNKIKYARVKEFVDEKPTDLKAYGLVNPSLAVDLYLGENKARKSLLIGNRKDGKYYAKDDSRDPVFLVDSTFVKELKIKLFDLRNKNVVKVNTSLVNRVEIEYPDAKFVCQKDTAQNWNLLVPEERKAKNWKVSGISSTLNNLRVEEFVSEHPKSLSPYGLNKPRIKVILKNDDEQLAGVLIGNEKDGKVYVKNISKEAVYLVKSNVVKNLTFKLNDLAEEKKKEEKEKK